MNSQKRRNLVRIHRLALIASVVVHAGALIGLAAFNPQPPKQPSLLLGEKTSEVIVLTATYEEPQHVRLDMPVSESPIIIMPRRARFSGRWWTDTPGRLVEVEDLLPPDILEIVLAGEALETIPMPTPEDKIESQAVESPATKQPTEKQTVTSNEELQRSPVQTLPPPMNQQAKSTDDAGSVTTSRAAFSDNRPPRYPAIALQRGWQGRVLLRLSVAADGRVAKVEVVQSSGHKILDAAAVAAVRTWKGRPALRNGKPIASVEVLPVRFRLP